MAEALQNFELSALYFDPRLLLLGGFVVVVAGLGVWLGGLRWAGLIAAFLGAEVGLISACAFSSRARVAMIILPAVAAAVAALLKKPVIVLSGAASAAAVTLFVLAGPALFAETLRGPSHPVPRDGTTLGMAETAIELGEELLFWGDAFLGAVKRMSPAGWAAGALAAAVVLGAGFVLTRLVTAVTCAWLGTASIFGGMILLLLYKGARPLTFIYDRTAFFGLIVLVMVGFGTLSQLLLCPMRRRKPQAHAKHKGGS